MMTIEQLEDYMMALFARQDEFGAAYVTRQVEWAESEIQKKLTAIKISSMANAQHVIGSTCRADDMRCAVAMVAR